MSGTRSISKQSRNKGTVPNPSASIKVKKQEPEVSKPKDGVETSGKRGDNHDEVLPRDQVKQQRDSKHGLVGRKNNTAETFFHARKSEKTGSKKTIEQKSKRATSLPMATNVDDSATRQLAKNLPQVRLGTTAPSKSTQPTTPVATGGLSSLAPDILQGNLAAIANLKKGDRLGARENKQVRADGKLTHQPSRNQGSLRRAAGDKREDCVEPLARTFAEAALGLAQDTVTASTYSAAHRGLTTLAKTTYGGTVPALNRLVELTAPKRVGSLPRQLEVVYDKKQMPVGLRIATKGSAPTAFRAATQTALEESLKLPRQQVQSGKSVTRQFETDVPRMDVTLGGNALSKDPTEATAQLDSFLGKDPKLTALVSQLTSVSTGEALRVGAFQHSPLSQSSGEPALLQIGTADSRKFSHALSLEPNGAVRIRSTVSHDLQGIVGRNGTVNVDPKTSNATFTADILVKPDGKGGYGWSITDATHDVKATPDAKEPWKPEVKISGKTSTMGVLSNSMQGLTSTQVLKSGILPVDRTHFEMGGRLYTLDERLGQGTFGTGWRAQTLDGHQVAAKVMNDSADLDGFIDEGRGMSTVSAPQNKNVARMLGETWFTVDNTAHWVVVSEMGSGGSLSNALADWDFVMDPLTARRLMRGLTDGVKQLHDQGLIHMDIKPDNAVVDLHGMEAKLIDFGTLAKAGTSGEGMGTLNYAAPEVMAARKKGEFLPYDTSQDIYSLGVTFKDFAGRIWFGQDRKNLEDLAALMMSKNPKDRPTIDQVRAHTLFSDLDEKAAREKMGEAFAKDLARL